MAAAVSVVLLPGMDGTGRLFEPFLKEFPAGLRSVVVSYAPDRPLGYSELEPFIELAIPVEGPFVILAESFSGPLALRIAARGHPRLTAIVLVASFVRSPLSRFLSGLRWMVGSWCFRTALPAWAIRRFLAGDNAGGDLVADVRSAVATVNPPVMAKRLREVLKVDDREILRLIQVPVLSISGRQDRLISPGNIADFRVLGELLENVVVDAPHLVLQRQPAAAVRIIGDFLCRRTHNLSE